MIHFLIGSGVGLFIGLVIGIFASLVSFFLLYKSFESGKEGQDGTC